MRHKRNLPSVAVRMEALKSQVQLRKKRGNYRLKWAILDGRRLKLSVRAIAEVLRLPVDEVEWELERMREQAQ